MDTDRMKPGILIFAGTTEGRSLAEYASANSVRCFVSVATDYGKSLLEKLENIILLTGRMDEKEMERFIEENDIRLVIDATHPFAREVTENIRSACEKARAYSGKVRYVRCVRPFEKRASSGQSAETSEKEDRAAGEEDTQDERIIYTESVQDAVEYLKKTTGNILIATGSKELHLYTEIDNYRERCFARVLSTEPTVKESVRLGFEGSHLFAMQGPFAPDLALLRQTKAAYFVTKETGKAGGFDEKAEAAEMAGAVLVVIGRPDETGESVEAVEKMIKEYAGEQNSIPASRRSVER